METPTLLRHALMLGMLMMLTGLVCGCASIMNDEESELPWNTPQSWEGSPSIPGLSDR